MVLPTTWAGGASQTVCDAAGGTGCGAGLIVTVGRGIRVARAGH